MFRLNSIQFNNGNDHQVYTFSNHAFVYGRNTVGKTALTKAIDYVLGSSDMLTYQGLDNIESIEAYLTNEHTKLWIKRVIGGGFFYKRTADSQYSEVSAEVYKENICLIITPTTNSHYIDVYAKVFGEKPSFRSFNFLNYIEEKGLGDLSIVFTKAKELKHQIRLRNIMNFFFNFENAEQIYEKELRLEQVQKELGDLADEYQEYHRSVFRVKNLFQELNLHYSDNYEKDKATFETFKKSYTRKARVSSKDLVYLSKASFSLAEEIKLYTFMRDQSQNMAERKERIKRLLSILNSIASESSDYSEYTQTISTIVKEIEKENVILSLTDYSKSIKGIQKEKEKLDHQLEILRAQASQLTYEDAMKKVGILEHIFRILSREFDVEKHTKLQSEETTLKQEIKDLRAAFDKSKITKFNQNLSAHYLSSGLSVKHLIEDRDDVDFALSFDPFKLCLFASHTVDDRNETFIPGSMTRQTHLQMLVYLCMFEYLNANFTGFIHLPILIIDSANQPMGMDIFKEVYPTIIAFADQIGIQTIFMSKDKLESVATGDLIDISAGLNKFHKK